MAHAQLLMPLVTINITHIPGIDNSTADALSRFQMTGFRRLVSGTAPHPTLVRAQHSDRDGGIVTSMHSLIRHAVTPSTRRVYVTGFDKFQEFCI